MYRQVIIMRGLPGSGKSTKVEEVLELANYLKISIQICSADNFRYEDGKYIYEKGRLPHFKCFELFKDSINKSIEIVVVDNTNVSCRSMKPYVKYALDNNYKIEFVSIEPIDLETLVKRNKHQVPLESLEKMLARWVSNPTIEEILNSQSDLD